MLLTTRYEFNQVAQSMWDSLPDYLNDTNVIAVVDNSGSMLTAVAGKVTALDVAASLGMYVAQRSTGDFKDLSISFSDDAKFVKHSGNVNERLSQVCSADWGSTNLHSVFKLILDHAMRYDVDPSDMPSMILILSDMQFNNCVRHDDSAIAMIRRKYEDAGYEMPRIVFWNLCAKGTKPVRFDENNTALVSGFSPALLESLLSGDLKQFTPESVMMKTIGKERYNW
jgi:hypothetical protein